jgi:hypothetical protein
MVGSYYFPRYNFSLDIGSFLLNSIKNLIVTYCMRIIQMGVQFSFLVRVEFLGACVNVSLLKFLKQLTFILFMCEREILS